MLKKLRHLRRSSKLKHFKWTPQLSVGNDKIDEQHKNAILELGKLEANLGKEEDLKVIRKCLHFLDSHIKKHFFYEEDYMKEHNYPGLKKHKEVRELITTRKIDLSLCGHMHYEYADIDDTGRGEICAGSVTRSGSLTIIEYNKKDDTFSYKVHKTTTE